MSFFYFPVARGLKVPHLPGDWRSHATDDEAVIQGWLDQGLNLAVDCERSGISVIDVDGPQGALWEGLKRLPPTYTVQTPHGCHAYFLGALRPSVSKIAPKIDTRGLGSYVLVPPSETPDGAYTVLEPREIAPLPGWVAPALEAASPQRNDRASVSELDLPTNVARAVRWLEARAVAVQGQGADHLTFEAACQLRDLGLSPEKSIEVMLKHYKLDPVDERFDAFITRKVENAEAYSQNEAGAWGTTSLADSFGGYLDSLPPEPEGGGRPDPFHAHNEAEQDGFTEPTYLIPSLLPDHSVVLLYGQPGSYKSFLALDIGLTLAAGQMGWGMSEADPRCVIYVAGEGPRSIARLRRPAWRTVRGLDAAVPFHLVTNMPLAADFSQVAAFVASIKTQGLHPGLVIIDTWARFVWGLNENDAKDAGLAVAALEYIKRELRCTVLVVHHSGKDGEKGPRGSGAILAGVDATHEVIPHKETKVVAVYNRRQKDADERAAPWLFEGKEAAGSLVFQPITPEAYRQLTQADDALDPRKVGAALIALKAIGGDNAVATHVLASKLRNQPAEEGPEATQAGVERVARQLRAAARGRLEAYCERKGNELVWFMPGQG